MSQNNELKSIKDLENYNFLIPNYQRGSRWSDREVGTLLEDIWDFANTEQKDSFYCLQPIVVKQNGKQYNVIDGQQRLTTIFLIVKFLNKKDFFVLDYQTRNKSADFLKNIDESVKQELKNIDFFHFIAAYQIITKFFEDKGINDRKKFIDTLLNSCKVLWYEAQENEYDVFIRLNIGKIPLLEAENIKALFLNKNDELDDDDIKDRAEFWYESEIKAREKDDFRYCILSKIMPNDILKDENNKPTLRDDILRIEAYLKAIVQPNKSNKHYLFDYFYKNYKNKTLNGEWKKLQSAIKTLSSFASEQSNDIVNREIFHYLGFLTLSNYSIFEIYKKWVDLQDNKEFSNTLLQTIKERVKNYINDIESLGYGNKEDKDKIFLLLLLFNLEYMILDESSRDFFKFNRFVLEQWSLEHIYAQNSKSITKIIKDKDNDGISAWLKEVLRYIDDDELKQEVEQNIQNNDFNVSLFAKIDENFKNDNTLNSIANLALLDRESNSRLGNLIFSQKHKEIYKLGSQDKLIPIMTKKVFAKDIEGLDYGHKDFFSETDRKAYLTYINKLLDKYRSQQ